MRIVALLFLASTVAAGLRASPWGLELGLEGGIGASQFVGSPTAQPPATDPTNLFAIFPPSATGSGSIGLAGSAGLSAMVTRKRRLYVGLELLASSESERFDETQTFPDGTTLKKATAWEWSGFRPQWTLGYAWPHKMGAGWALAPRLSGGVWYEKISSYTKVQGVDGGDAKPLDWQGPPPDDWGYLAGVGLDWLRLGPGNGPARIALDLRWRQGHALVEPAAGADQPLDVFEAVLTVPVWLGVW